MRKIFKIESWHSRFPFTLGLWVLLGALLFLGIVVVVFDRYQAKRIVTKTDSASLIVRSITESDHVIGKVSAPVQVIVYSSLSCTYCKSLFDDTLPKLMSTYGDNIVVAYRHLPLVSQPSSHLEASAAECVYALGGNDSFWKFVRAVFGQPASHKGLSLSTLESIANGVGVSGAQMSLCVQSGESDARIRADALEASVAGISQTPGIVLKSAARALIVQGNYFGRLDSGIKYLLKAGR
ncbi:MAG: DsbA family protein [Minisyncoccota bacterium]